MNQAALDIVRAERMKLEECAAAFRTVEKYLELKAAPQAPAATALPAPAPALAPAPAPAPAPRSMQEHLLEHAKANNAEFRSVAQLAEACSASRASVYNMLGEHSEEFESEKRGKERLWRYKSGAAPAAPAASAAAELDAPAAVRRVAVVLKRLGAAQSYKVAAEAKLPLAETNSVLAGSKWFMRADDGRYLLSAIGDAALQEAA